MLFAIWMGMGALALAQPCAEALVLECGDVITVTLGGTASNNLVDYTCEPNDWWLERKSPDKVFKLDVGDAIEVSVSAYPARYAGPVALVGLAGACAPDHCVDFEYNTRICGTESTYWGDVRANEYCPPEVNFFVPNDPLPLYVVVEDPSKSEDIRAQLRVYCLMPDVDDDERQCAFHGPEEAMLILLPLLLFRRRRHVVST